MPPVDYPHQRTGSAFLAERRFAYLADDMGLGKCRTAILAADLVGAERVLVACPGAVRQTWAREFEKWSDRARPLHVVGGLLTRPPGDGVTIVSHAVFSDAPPVSSRPRPGRGGSLAHLFAKADYDVLVIDESHEFRRYDASRTKTLFAPDGLAARAKRTWCLSGTPFVNSAADLYPMALGALRSPASWTEFCSHYCEMRPDPYVGVKPVGVRNAAELADGLRPHLLRRTVESLGIPMPPLAVERVALAGVDPAAVAAAMAGLEGWTPARLAEMLAERDELRDSGLSRVRHALGAAKAAAAAAHVEVVLASGEGPVVAFFQHTAVRRAMHAALAAAGRRCSWIDGTIGRAQLGAAESWFQQGRLDALLVQTQSGGQGLTLTRAHRAAMVELPWTATAMMQAIKRIHRIGQNRACTAEILVAPGCWLEDTMAGVVSTKRRAADDLLDRLTTCV